MGEQSLSNNRVIEAWERLERILEQKAPKTRKALEDGAQLEFLESLERELDVELPADFIDFYRRHNGEKFIEELEEGIFEFGYFIPVGREDVESVEEEWERLGEAAEQISEEEEPIQVSGPARAVYFDKKWIPFVIDYSGNYLCFDLHPARGGKIGQIIKCDYDAEVQVEVVASSISEFLDQVSHRLEIGEREIDEREWSEVVIRVENVKNRDLASRIVTSSMKEMDLELRLVEPDVILQARPNATPPLEKKAVVAFSVYDPRFPGGKILRGYGGDTEVKDLILFQQDFEFPVTESGITYHHLDPNDNVLYPIFHLTSNREIPGNVGLQVTLRRRA